MIDDTQEFHSQPPRVLGLPGRPGENTAQPRDRVSQPRSQGEKVEVEKKEKKRRRGGGEVRVEVKQTAITVISGDKLWESPRRSFTGPGPVRAEINASWLFLPLIVSKSFKKKTFV